jgi:hypothetical protein
VLVLQGIFDIYLKLLDGLNQISEWLACTKITKHSTLIIKLITLLVQIKAYICFTFKSHSEKECVPAYFCVILFCVGTGLSMG